MLIRFLQNFSIAYDGINIINEKKNTKKNVQDDIAKRLILCGKAETYRVLPESSSGNKQVKEYENKQIKNYENKKESVKRGRPKKEVK
jgi:hypothetical protein